MLLAGCQTAPKKSSAGKTESQQEAVSAIGTMTQGLTNQEIGPEDLKRLAVQVRKDPQAQSAVKAVNSAFDIQDAGIKYCPVDGKRFSSRLEICPVHKVKLLPLDE
jgi:hypothetical protein